MKFLKFWHQVRKIPHGKVSFFGIDLGKRHNGLPEDDK